MRCCSKLGLHLKIMESKEATPELTTVTPNGEKVPGGGVMNQQVASKFFALRVGKLVLVLITSLILLLLTIHVHSLYLRASLSSCCCSDHIPQFTAKVYHCTCIWGIKNSGYWSKTAWFSDWLESKFESSAMVYDLNSKTLALNQGTVGGGNMWGGERWTLFPDAKDTAWHSYWKSWIRHVWK